MNAHEIINRILEFVSKVGGEPHLWYFGIAENPEERLFVQHKLRKDIDPCIYGECENSNVAREIEKYFLENLGFSGGSGGGGYLTRYVYAYRIAPHTEE